MPQWTQLPSDLHSIVASTPESVLLQTSRFDASNHHSYLFLNPIATISAVKLNELPELFRKIEDALANGLHVAGFLSYECGYYFERFDEVELSPQAIPLAWFGVYASPIIYDHANACFEGAKPLLSPEGSQQETRAPFTESAALTISEDEYRAKILKIKRLHSSRRNLPGQLHRLRLRSHYEHRRIGLCRPIAVPACSLQCLPQRSRPPHPLPLT